jgi:hypothetical protein
MSCWPAMMLLVAGLAHGAPRAAPRQTRDLGSVTGFGETLVVPTGGLRFEFLAVPPARTRRTMLDVSAIARAGGLQTPVRLHLSVPGVLTNSSHRECFEHNVGPPPFAQCTAVAGGGWKDGRPRKVVLTVDNLVRKPVSIDFRIVVMDPLER